MDRANVLFVDDDPYFLKGIERALRGSDSGWNMAFVDNGRDAFKLMSEAPPDVVIADMNMPQMSGDVLLGKVRHRFPKTRHIVLSGQCDQSSAYRLIGSEHTFLSKPCDIGLLVDSINAAIARGGDTMPGEELSETAPAAPTKDTVLLIENSHIQGRLIAERIRALSDVRVTVANTFAEAKTAIESLSDRIFMAVTAMFLTDADGLEVVDHLLAKNLPCVVLTASHDEGLRSQSRSKPILDYFLKSTLYDDRRLFDLIRRTFENDLTTVLAVDDSRTDLHLVTDLLKSMNFRVLSATSGDEALGILAGDPSIRIVVTDNDMPGMNGIDFTAELRRRLGDEDMIVIGMSSAVDVTARFLKAGCNDFIKKPFSAEEFYCRIQQNVQFFDKFVETKRLNARVSHEKAQSEKLLRNILPERVAAELKACGRVEPVSHESVSVLFADFVGFTHNAENLASAKLLEILVYYYGRFDDIVSQLWLEKIKTIGDCYMCVAGLASETENHAEEAVNAARAMMAAVENPPPGLFDDGMESWKLRIGIHSGPVTAGVVGTHNFAYDIWGDTVNTAARVEAVGDAGRINVSEATHALLPQNVAVEPRGHIPIKGKASLGMFFVA